MFLLGSCYEVIFVWERMKAKNTNKVAKNPLFPSSSVHVPAFPFPFSLAHEELMNSTALPGQQADPYPTTLS